MFIGILIGMAGAYVLSTLTLLLLLMLDIKGHPFDDACPPNVDPDLGVAK